MVTTTISRRVSDSGSVEPGEIVGRRRPRRRWAARRGPAGSQSPDDPITAGRLTRESQSFPRSDELVVDSPRARTPMPVNEVHGDDGWRRTELCSNRCKRRLARSRVRSRSRHPHADDRAPSGSTSARGLDRVRSQSVADGHRARTLGRPRTLSARTRGLALVTPTRDRRELIRPARARRAAAQPPR